MHNTFMYIIYSPLKNSKGLSFYEFDFLIWKNVIKILQNYTNVILNHIKNDIDHKSRETDIIYNGKHCKNCIIIFYIYLIYYLIECIFSSSFD